MEILRHPLLPIGLILLAVGIGNWYTGRSKSVEYEQILASGNRPAPVEDFADFDELTAGTTATLLSNLRRGTDEYTLVNSKLDFYKLVQSGGRLFILVGLFCSAAGLIRFWYRRRAQRAALV